MEAESSVNKIPGLSAPDSHGIRFLVTTPACRDAIFMVAASQTPTPTNPSSLPCKRAISGSLAAHLL